MAKKLHMGGSIPKKLSELENDLFYSKGEVFLTLTAEDFTPQYVLDDDGNPTDEVEYWIYERTPKLDWLTTPESIGWVTKFVDGDYTCWVTHNKDDFIAPDDSEVFSDTSETHIDVWGEDGNLYADIFCEMCSMAMVNGIDTRNDGIDADLFTLLFIGTPSPMPITIYKVDCKRIPKHLMDTDDIKEEFINMYSYQSGMSDNIDGILEHALFATSNCFGTNIMGNPVSIACGNGTWVAVTSATTDAVYYSEDGYSWNQSTLPDVKNWCRVVYCADKFIVIATDSNIAAYSEDGITWTSMTVPQLSNECSIAYGNGKIVLLPSGYGNVVYYSEDGFTWNKSTLPERLGWDTLAYCKDRFMLLASGTIVNHYCYSEDGISWVKATTLPTKDAWRAIAYGNGKFVAIHSIEDIAVQSTIAYSEDGINWSLTDSPVLSGDVILSIAYGNGLFVATVGASYYQYSRKFDKVIVSEDGINWTTVTTPFTSLAVCVIYDGEKFIATGQNDEKIKISRDGIIWKYGDYGIYHSKSDVTIGIRNTIIDGGAIPTPPTAAIGQTIVVTAVDETGKPIGWKAVDPTIITSSTEGSTKRFKVTVDDTGTLTTIEIT